MQDIEKTDTDSKKYQKNIRLIAFINDDKVEWAFGEFTDLYAFINAKAVKKLTHKEAIAEYKKCIIENKKDKTKVEFYSSLQEAIDNNNLQDAYVNVEVIWQSGNDADKVKQVMDDLSNKPKVRIGCLTSFQDQHDLSALNDGLLGYINNICFITGFRIEASTLKQYADKIEVSCWLCEFGKADFNVYTFKHDFYVIHSTFTKQANFSFATFNAKASFHNVTFKFEVNFSNATFEAYAEFYDSTFTGELTLSNCNFKQVASFLGSVFLNTVYTAGASFNTLNISGSKWANVMVLNTANIKDLQASNIELINPAKEPITGEEHFKTIVKPLSLNDIKAIRKSYCIIKQSLLQNYDYVESSRWHGLEMLVQGEIYNKVKQEKIITFIYKIITFIDVFYILTPPSKSSKKLEINLLSVILFIFKDIILECTLLVVLLILYFFIFISLPMIRLFFLLTDSNMFTFALSKWASNHRQSFFRPILWLLLLFITIAIWISIFECHYFLYWSLGEAITSSINKSLEIMLPTKVPSINTNIFWLWHAILMILQVVAKAITTTLIWHAIQASRLRLK